MEDLLDELFEFVKSNPTEEELRIEFERAKIKFEEIIDDICEGRACASKDFR